MRLNNLPFLLPNNEEKAVISKEVKVDADKLANGTKLFKEWLKSENHLPNDVGEVLIRNFLYGCKGNLEIAKSKFEKYMVNRTKLTQLYNDREVKNDRIKPWGLHRLMYVAPKLTPDGYRVVIVRIPSSDSTHFDCSEACKRMLLQFDLQLFKDENSGYEFIYDVKNFSTGIFGKVNINIVLQLFQMMYNILPFRLKAIHLVNTTPSMTMLLSMTMRIVSKKLQKRFHHRKLEELTQYLPIECLPNEYGGTAGKYDVICDRYNNFLMENLKWINYTEEFKLTGSIPGHKQTSCSFEEFSMNGSFRKLNID